MRWCGGSRHYASSTRTSCAASALDSVARTVVPRVPAWVQVYSVQCDQRKVSVSRVSCSVRWSTMCLLPFPGCNFLSFRSWTTFPGTGRSHSTSDFWRFPLAASNRNVSPAWQRRFRSNSPSFCCSCSSSIMLFDHSTDGLIEFGERADFEFCGKEISSGRHFFSKWVGEAGNGRRTRFRDQHFLLQITSGKESSRGFQGSFLAIPKKNYTSDAVEMAECSYRVEKNKVSGFREVPIANGAKMKWELTGYSASRYPLRDHIKFQ